MITNVIKAENTAIREIEAALTEAGWSDGWAMEDADVRTAGAPIFYRNNAPVVAAEARTTVGADPEKQIDPGQTHYLYLIYNITQTETKNAGNRPYYHEVTAALTFYYDDPSLFYEATGDSAPTNGFVPFLSELIDELADGDWAISSEGESTVPATDDGTTYTNRKILFVTKNF